MTMRTMLMALWLLGACAAPSTEPTHAPVYLPREDALVQQLRLRPSWPSSPAPSLTLVESLPVGNFSLESAVPQTFDALYEHVQSAQQTIDLSAMYWNLRGKEDRQVYSDAEMQRFGADRGLRLLQALHDAAARGVILRIVTVSGAKDSLPSEVQELVKANPSHVQVHCWSGPQWYGGGILHQKIWVFDRQHAYVGSANMDWKSLAQVMEVGVLLKNLPPTSPVLQDLQKLFDLWWLWSAPGFAPPNTTATYFSDRFQSQLQVPKWSLYLPTSQRIADPFVRCGLSALGNITHQIPIELADGASSKLQTAQLFVSAAPLEATAGRSRAFDEDALVYTIQSAQKRVGLSVMDFTPYSMYALDTHKGPIWWPALTDALVAGVFGKRGLHVRLLISQWQHTRAEMLTALSQLQHQAELCKSMRPACSGRLEIKIFHVPGWANTTSSSTTKAAWPSFTRVNHAKYIVTDKRANVGTSNMEWGYFYTTAGTSVNTNHEPTRQALESVFFRNWNSSYAQPLAA